MCNRSLLSCSDAWHDVYQMLIYCYVWRNHRFFMTRVQGYTGTRALSSPRGLMLSSPGPAACKPTTIQVLHSHSINIPLSSDRLVHQVNHVLSECEGRLTCTHKPTVCCGKHYLQASIIIVSSYFPCLTTQKSLVFKTDFIWSLRSSPSSCKQKC